ncbi:glycerol-3-phosphate acyltransferase 2, mitochondrial isoform X2 [Ornithorhynchus anatinus]|uniref:glycerol-3-phosphate acyltransferase 2, mitochondrial isoform X2 n=1 Tax=Ornithorhynchus anatinus TaxID=9258 RepID=UPI0010A789E2|nr:glycerol-3-phosphate acyltransferase 2, mitochondrial isoform X2 [Ornithorhynchus anatinus]
MPPGRDLGLPRHPGQGLRIQGPSGRPGLCEARTMIQAQPPPEGRDRSPLDPGMWPMAFGVKLETVTPFLGKYRPFVGRCCQSCTPRSWESLFDKNITTMGFHNVILVTENSTRYRGWLVRRFCCVMCVLGWNIPPPDGAVQDRIVSSKRVQEALGPRAPQEAGDGPRPKSWTREARHILGQIQASVSPPLLRLFSWILLRFLNSVFVNVQLHQGQLTMVRQALEPGVPLVFLSTHKSHLDGLLLPLLLLSQRLGVVHVAWDPQSCSPVLRALLRRLGGLFLPVGADLSPGGPGGDLPGAILHAAVERLLVSGQPLLIFLEGLSGGGSRLSAHGQAWLSLVLRATREGAVSDVALVPVGIAYDLTPGAPPAESQGSTSPLGLWSVALAGLRGLAGRLGCVRVDFSQPFSLQEFMANSPSRRPGGRSLEDLLLPAVLGQWPVPSDCERAQMCVPAPGALGSPEQADGFLLGSLSCHILHASVSSSAVMAVSVMAALLLHKHPEGLFLSKLLGEFSWLTEETLLRGFDVGFSGRLRHLVLHALRLLRDGISLWRLPHGDVLVLPKAGPSRLQLAHRSAALLPVFLCEAVGACAVRALLVSRLPPGGPWELQSMEPLSQRDLHQQTLLLLHLLPQDCLLLQPCQSFYCYCQEVLDRLIQCGLLVAEEAPGTRPACDTSRRRFQEKLLWRATDDFSDSDSDFADEADGRCFTLSQQARCPDFFLFLGRLLGPLLTAFARAAAFLRQGTLPDTESGYAGQLHAFLLKRAREDCTFECASWELAVKAVQTFRELGVLREHPGPPGPQGPQLCLAPTFTEQKNQEQLEHFIRQFILA